MREVFGGVVVLEGRSLGGHLVGLGRFDDKRGVAGVDGEALGLLVVVGCRLFQFVGRGEWLYQIVGVSGRDVVHFGGRKSIFWFDVRLGHFIGRWFRLSSFGYGILRGYGCLFFVILFFGFVVVSAVGPLVGFLPNRLDGPAGKVDR